MNAGKLRHRITIEHDTGTTPDAAGHRQPAWTSFAVVWAECRQLSGREHYLTHQVMPLATHRIRMRYLPGVTTAMRVVWKERTLNVLDVDDLEGRNIEHVLLAGEKK